eukprot:TRINITY_DN52779_c0_g2_i1.p2 TRINITY_DN52779_c0_g2~~TRINITY_DN52779_c0_g2_i1.p2  ORF type:complete len:256 (-),score=-11.93 TRINITY_DN52779_c0_g2_i1:135-902(-)
MLLQDQYLLFCLFMLFQHREHAFHNLYRFHNKLLQLQSRCENIRHHIYPSGQKQIEKTEKAYHKSGHINYEIIEQFLERIRSDAIIVGASSAQYVKISRCYIKRNPHLGGRCVCTRYRGFYSKNPKDCTLMLSHASNPLPAQDTVSLWINPNLPLASGILIWDLNVNVAAESKYTAKPISMEKSTKVVQCYEVKDSYLTMKKGEKDDELVCVNDTVANLIANAQQLILVNDNNKNVQTAYFQYLSVFCLYMLQGF